MWVSEKLNLKETTMSGTLWLILIIGLPLVMMMLMHRGGGHAGGMGCGMGHGGHNHGSSREETPSDGRQSEPGTDQRQPVGHHH